MKPLPIKIEVCFCRKMTRCKQFVSEQRQRLTEFVEQHIEELQLQRKRYMAKLVAQFNELYPETPTTINIMRDTCTKYRAAHNISKVYAPNKYYLPHVRIWPRSGSA